MKRRAPLAVVALVTLALLTSCSAAGESDGGAAATSTRTGKGERATKGTDGSDASEGAAAGDGAAGVADVDPADVLAEQTYTVPGSDDTATIGVHSLQVDGDVMTLRLVFTPDFSSVSASGAVSIFDVVGHAGRFNPALVDREHLKEYDVIDDTGIDWASDTVYTRVTNGEPMVWWGVYAAPEDDIDTVDVRVLDELPEFTDVPITR